MIEITLSSLFLASAFTGTSVYDGAMKVEKTEKAYTVSSESLEENTIPTQVVADEEHSQPQTLEKYVREYFKDAPLLAEIAKCESTFRHFGKDGKPIRGIENRYDVGLMQINEKYHGVKAKKDGFDIYTLDGNMGYAKWLYEKSGSSPWVHSSKCWKKYETLANK